MPVRLLQLAAVLALVAVPAPARPQAAAEAAPPALVVRVKSINDLAADLKYVAEKAGQGGAAEQADAILKLGFGEGGQWEAIDPGRPIGLFGTGTNVVVMVPVTSAKAALDLLERLNVTAEKGKDDIYTIKSLPVPAVVGVYLRFAHQYAFVSVPGRAALQKLPDPAKLLAAAQARTLSAALHFDRLPDGLKQVALSQIDHAAVRAQDQKRRGETAAEHTLHVALIKHAAAQVSSVIKAGGTLEAYLDVDRNSHRLVAQASLTGKDGSPLATGLADLAKARSLFAGMTGGSNAAMGLLLHLALPADVRQALEPVIDDHLRKALAGESNEALRAQGAKVLQALEPTLKAGHVDVGLSMRGPDADQRYTIVAGARVQDGRRIEAALRDAIGTLPAGDRQLIHLDAETAGDVKIHRVEAQKHFDADARKVLGDTPMYLAVRSDAALVAFGPEALPALKEALGAQPQATPAVRLRLALARMAPLMAGEYPGASKAAEAAFGQAPGADHVQFTLEGGKSLKVSLSVDADVAAFLAKLQPGRGSARRAPGKKTTQPKPDSDK